MWLYLVKKLLKKNRKRWCCDKILVHLKKFGPTTKAQTKRVFNLGHFHLHQAWPSYLFSMPCICLETSICLQMKGSSNKISPSNLMALKSWSLQISLCHNPKTSIHFKYVTFGTSPSMTPQHCAWSLIVMATLT